MSAAVLAALESVPTFPRSSRYRVGRAIADGTSGAVYVGFQRGASGFERVVVIEHAPDVPRDALFAELSRTIGFRHGNVVGIDDIEEHDAVYLVSEYVEGTSLEDLVALATDRRLSSAIALRIARDVRRGLEAIHEAGYVHRHVSAKNVLVGSDGVARLTAFGLPEKLASKRGPRPVPTPSDDVAAFLRLVEELDVSGSDLESAPVDSVASHEEVADFVEQVACETLAEQRSEIRANAFVVDDVYEEVSGIRPRILIPPEVVAEAPKALDVPKPVEVRSIKADLAKLALALFLVAALCLTTAFACGAFFR